MKTDYRNIKNGLEIPSASYSDQPYIVKTDDGAWLCCVTTGSGHEGASGQHIITMRSSDCGNNWSSPVPIEKSKNVESSYAAMLKVPSGRIYIFYNHNSDNIRTVKCHNGGEFTRVDSLGHYVFKYSDDHGMSWSEQRYDIPVRLFQCDRDNVYGGKLCFFWNVGKPFAHDGAAFVSLHKVGQMGEGFFQQSEGVLLKSSNLISESDPAKISWETLPDGDTGLRAPEGGGSISEEQSYVVLSDGSFYVTYRSVDGYPVESYSRDGGHTWCEPEYKYYADGHKMKNPRAANFVWKCENGKYLYWFHNHGGHFIRKMWGQGSEDNGLIKNGKCSPYDDRNPVWLCGGVEVDSPEGKVLKWSQPEIVLYDDDPYLRMSYPDMIEEDGKTFLTETQKDKARIHDIPRQLLDGLWKQFDKITSIAQDGLMLNLPESGGQIPVESKMPELPEFIARDAKRTDFGSKNLYQGFSLDMWIQLDSLAGGQVILDSRTDYGQGLCLQTTGKGTIEIILNDGRTENRWDCDPDMLETGKLHHVAVIIDGGPKIISFVVDGKFCDGGDYRQFGWGRFSPNLRDANGSSTLKITSEIQSIRIYNRYLRTSEVINNFKAK